MEVVKMENKHKWFQLILAPFEVLRVEKIYYIWFLSLAISFAGIILDCLNKNADAAFSNGTFYGTGIAVIAPFFVDFIVDYQSSHRKQKEETFSTYKSWSFLASLVVVFILVLLFRSDYRTSKCFQIICTVMVTTVSFYSYLVYKMADHLILMEQYSDRPYVEEENRVVKQLSRKAKRTKRVTNSDGKEVKL